MQLTWNLTNIVGLVIGLLFLGVGFKLFGKKRGRKYDTFKTVGFALVGVVFVFGMWMNAIPNFLGDISLSSGGGGGTGVQRAPSTVTQVSSACGDDNKGTLYARAEDIGASTLTYYAAQFYLLNDDGTLTPWMPIGGTSSPGYGSNESVACNKKYILVGETSAGTHASVPPQEFVLDEEEEYLHFDGYKLSKGQVHVVDETDNKRYLGADNQLATNSTGFVDLNSTKVTHVTDATCDDIDVGSDGYIDDTIYIKSGTANEFVVEPDMPLYICVDTGTDNEWQEPVISWNGHKLSSDGVLGSMEDHDLTGSYVSAAEWCYKVDPEIHQGIPDTQTQIDFYIKARSGQNPDTSNDDIVIAFLGEGRFKSSEEDTVKRGVYTDASSQALVVSATNEVPIMTYQIK